MTGMKLVAQFTQIQRHVTRFYILTLYVPNVEMCVPRWMDDDR